jgi:hypothetical protein
MERDRGERALSEASGVSVPWIYGMQHAPRGGVWITITTLKLVAKALGVEFKELLDDN